ncbi:peptidylprolyl isomerase [compost metagenome]
MRADLTKGMDFAIVARDRSLDDMTANSGGELGWVEEDDPFVLAPVLEAAKQLKAKEISKPVAVEQGFAIVHLMDRRTKPNLERALVRESVRKELALREAPPLKEIVNKLRSKWGAVIVDTQFK